jgi:hypothetical protein
MQVDHPVDRLSEAILALEGVCDLLCQISGRDMHLVDPEHFYSTLAMPVRQARQAYEDLTSGQ